MKIRFSPYLRLWRPAPLLWAALVLINPVVSSCFPHSPQTFPLRFLGGHLLLPFSFGAILALIVARAIHQPAFGILPGARRYYLRAQCGGFAVFAVLATAIAVLADSTVPWAGTLGLVMGIMALALPWEPIARWAGSPRLLGGVVVLMAFAGWNAGEVRRAAQEFPWVVLVLGSVMTVAGFRLAFAREQLRARSLTLMGIFGGSWRVMGRQALAKQKTKGEDWPRAPLGQSLSAWRRALSHERFGAMPRGSRYKVGAGAVLLYGALGAGALATHMYFKHELMTFALLAQKFHALVWCEGMSQTEAPLLSFLASMVLVMVFAMTLVLPIPARLYPASRQTLLRLALELSFSHMIRICLYGVLGIAVLAWGASLLAGEHFGFRRISIFALPLTVLPFLPLLASATLGTVRHAGNPAQRMFSKAGLMGLVILTVSAVAAFLLSMFPDTVFKPVGLLCLALGTLLSSAWLAARARKIYLSSDLLTRSGAL